MLIMKLEEVVAAREDGGEDVDGLPCDVRQRESREMVGEGTDEQRHGFSQRSILFWHLPPPSSFRGG